MRLNLIEEKHFKEIREVDYLAFSRPEPRRMVNIESLGQSTPDGSFVALEDGKVVGYVFCKVLGNEGFIGPIGVHPDFEGRGYGKRLLHAAIEYLKTVCPVIGLEVNPLKTKNIYIYNKMGFITAFSTLIFDTTSSNAVASPSGLDIKQMDKQAGSLWIDELHTWIGKDFDGVSYKGEIKGALRHECKVLTARKSNESVGFISYGPTTSPFAWGAVKNTPVQAAVLKELVNSINTYQGQHVPIAVNGKFTAAMRVLSSCNYTIRLSMNRMMLRGYEGDYFKASDSIMFRAWMN